MPGPISRNPTVAPTRPTDRPATTTPTVPTTPAASPGWSPAAPLTPTSAAALEAIRRLIQTPPSPSVGGATDFDLVPGRYPDAVPLPVVLKALSASPQGQAMVGKVLDQLTEKTGIPVPKAMRDAAMTHPEQATRAFEVTPQQLSAGMQAVNAGYHAGKLKQVEPRTFALPAKVDLAKLDDVAWTRPQPEMKELAPGLFQGDLPSTTPDADLKRSTLMAEVFQRLSSGDMEVTYGGKDYSKLGDLLGALKADGYEVNVSFQQRIANFANLKTQVGGQMVDVPTPLMVKTGIADPMGREAIVPSAHSEMVVSLRAGPNTRGPKLDADLKYYQGVSGTGFFPVGAFAEPKWCGKSTLATLEGQKALDAVALAGTFTDVVQQSAKALNLYADGYGMTGVCNDSVAVIEQAMTGKAHEYPLLMKDSTLLPELEKRLSDGDRSDDAAIRTLKKAIRDLPSDVRPNATLRERAKASIPWEPGQEPFQSTVDARKILGG